MSMSDRLRSDLAEYLMVRGRTFERIDGVTIDQDAATLDIGYRDEGGYNVLEIHDPEELLEFLVRKRD